MEKGRKAWFKIKKTIGQNNPCDFLEKLFDTLVPIMLHFFLARGGNSTLFLL
jgi:hypothetical protein